MLSGQVGTWAAVRSRPCSGDHCVYPTECERKPPPFEGNMVKTTRLHQRITAGLVTLAAAVTLSASIATPAVADRGDCLAYLMSWGYTINEQKRRACSLGETLLGFPYCVTFLQLESVTDAHTSRACDLAGFGM